jgi:hypothetical protein
MEACSFRPVGVGRTRSHMSAMFSSRLRVRRARGSVWCSRRTMLSVSVTNCPSRSE